MRLDVPVLDGKPIGNSQYFECYEWTKAYEYADWFLNGRDSLNLKGKTRHGNNTKLARYSGGGSSTNPGIAIYYHGTAIVIYYKSGDIVIRNGGWKTSTTKTRINFFSPVHIVQRNYEWFVYDHEFGTYLEYFSGMLVDDRGRPYVYVPTTV